MSDSYDKGLHSQQPSYNFQTGSQAWEGAMAAERMRWQQAEWDRQAQQQRDEQSRRANEEGARRAADAGSQQANALTTYSTSSGGSNYGSTSTGDGGGLGGIIALGVVAALVAGYFGAFNDHPNATIPKLSLSPGSLYRVGGCQFSGLKPMNSHFLVPDEQVRFMKGMPGADIQVSAFRNPYDGTSALGTISATCIKSAV